MPMLQQYGPKSLNFVSKKQAIKKIMHENSLLKYKIAQAKSSVTRDDLITHQAKVERHKKILKDQSTTQGRLDPLVNHHLRSRSDLQTLLVKSASRQSFTSFTTKPDLSKAFPFSLEKKRFLSLDPSSPRDPQPLILPDIKSRNLAPVIETTMEVARTPFLHDIGTKTVNHTMIHDHHINDSDVSELSRFNKNRRSHQSIDSTDGSSLRINTKHFKGFNVPAHPRRQRGGSTLNRSSFIDQDIIKIRVRQPSKEEFIDEDIRYNEQPMTIVDHQGVIQERTE